MRDFAKIYDYLSFFILRLELFLLILKIDSQEPTFLKIKMGTLHYMYKNLLAEKKINSEGD